MIRILFLESSKNFGGQEMRMLDLVKSLDKERFKAIIGAQAKSYLYKKSSPAWGENRACEYAECLGY
jgi:hypothetical protein